VVHFLRSKARHSAMAQKYAISSVAEATEYLNHPSSEKGSENVPGSLPPSRPLHSGHLRLSGLSKIPTSITLLHMPPATSGFLGRFERYFRSEFDRRTIERL